MASSLCLPISPNPPHSITNTPQTHLFRRVSVISTPNFVNWRRKVSVVKMSSAVSDEKHSYDVVVVGAGIIGLSIARQLLIASDLSVAVVDAHVPCSGATGAGALSIHLLIK